MRRPTEQWATAHLRSHPQGAVALFRDSKPVSITGEGFRRLGRDGIAKLGIGLVAIVTLRATPW